MFTKDDAAIMQKETRADAAIMRKEMYENAAIMRKEMYENAAVARKEMMTSMAAMNLENRWFSSVTFTVSLVIPAVNLWRSVDMDNRTLARQIDMDERQIDMDKKALDKENAVRNFGDDLKSFFQYFMPSIAKPSDNATTSDTTKSPDKGSSPKIVK